jgi:predicted DNA-binding transcriptional regulator AlpA
MTKNKINNDSNTFFDNQKWYIDDVVNYTGLKRKTIYNLTSLNEIPHFKQRKKLVFIPEEIRKWITPKEK